MNFHVSFHMRIGGMACFVRLGPVQAWSVPVMTSQKRDGCEYTRYLGNLENAVVQ